MILVVVALLVMLSPLLVRRMPALVLQSWRLAWLAPVALGLQVVAIELPVGRWAPPLHVLTYVLAGVVLWANRHVAGLWVVSAGAACNGVTIAANGGVLPTSPQAERAAGFDPDVEFLNSGVVEDPVLPWLGDVFAWPAPLPLANTFSVGDVLLVIGVGLLAWRGSVAKAAVDRREAPGVPTRGLPRDAPGVRAPARGTAARPAQSPLRGQPRPSGSPPSGVTAT